MTSIDIFARTEHFEIEDVFKIISNFEHYKLHSPVVRNIEILEKNDLFSLSKWEVNFRQGILCWQERDYFDSQNFEITFEQTEGDAAHFSGVWKLWKSKSTCYIHFFARFDMGIPSLADIIEPIAEQALRENINSILNGLLKNKIQFVSNIPSEIELNHD